MARALANAVTLLQHAMGEGALAVAVQHLGVVGRVLPVVVLTPHDKGVSPDAVLRVGELPARHRAVLEVVLVPGTTERALLEGHTL